MVFGLKLKRYTENLSQGRRVVLDTISCVEIATFLGEASNGLLLISPPRLTVGDFKQSIGGTSDFQVAELRSSSHQINLSGNSQLVLRSRQ